MRARSASILLRSLAWALAWAITALLALVVLMRLAWHDGLWLFLLLNVLTPYLYLPAWPIALVAALARRWRLATTAGVIIAFHAYWSLLPLLPHTPPAATGHPLKIVSANLLMVHDNPPLLAEELDRLDADVYFLQEVSARWDEELERRGFWQRHPYNRRVVSEDSFGCAIASRLPVRDLEVFWLAELPEMRGLLSYEGRDIELLTVHLLPPRTSEYVPYFRQGVDGLLEIVRRLGTHPFVLAGDFNATPDSSLAARIRPLADDAWELAGRGLGATWPNGLFSVPPVRLDHVFLSHDLTALDVAVGIGAGSDHRPLLARVARRAW
jgi:endonuclease/exonuclease/phosphatase (EEP) superfamily protein YafD